MQWFKDFKAAAATKIARFKNKTFSDAAMATCALMAAADGSVDAAERKKVVGLIGANELLQVFDAADLGKTFLAFCDKAGDEFARLDALSAVRKLKSDNAAADTCVRIAIIIANADGNFDEKEKAVVRELCTVLGLSAETYLA